MGARDAPGQGPSSSGGQLHEPSGSSGHVVNESMLLDGRPKFAITLPWASYCMLKPYVSPGAAAASTGRIIGRIDSPSADVLVPTVLHTTDPNDLPVSMRPQTLNVSRIPNDAFVVYLIVARLLDGRTVRCFHRFSEIREFVTSMKAAMGSALVEVVRFPWRRPHHSMVDTEQRRVLLEAYLSMLFAHNTALQTHPRAIQFLMRTDAADPSMGVAMSPSSDALNIKPPRHRANGRAHPHKGGGGGESVSARFVVSPTKRLITVVVDVPASAASGGSLSHAASVAAQLAVEKLRVASHNDLVDAKLISIEGVAPLAVAVSVGQALVEELGDESGYPAVTTEPNLQLLRAFHYHDQAGTGLVSAFRMGQVLSQLGVHVAPEVASDLLLQAVVDGETSALWTDGGGASKAPTQSLVDRQVDYHTFLILLIQRTQRDTGVGGAGAGPSIQGSGGRALLASAFSRTSDEGVYGGGAATNGITNANAGASVVEVATGEPMHASAVIAMVSAGTNFSVVCTVSAHGHGGLAAGEGLTGQGGGAMLGLGGMTEKGARFMDFKTQAERGLEVTIHKIKWPKMAAALHRAAGLDANETLKTGVAGSGEGDQSASAVGGIVATQTAGKPFLVSRARMVRLTENNSKLVWFKQGLKGAVSKVGRAFNSSLIRPADQPGASTFDLLQVTQVRVVEDPTTPLGRWFVFDPAKADCYVALVGLHESLYVEVASRAARDWLVGGFRQLLFGAEGRARARGHAHGRALQHSNGPSAGGGSDGAQSRAPPPGQQQQTPTTYTQGPRVANQPNQNALYVFGLFDRDANGTLDLDEATDALMWAGFAETPRDVRSIISKYDRNGDGLLDIDEFSRLMVELEHGSESMISVFKAFDISGDGFIGEFELGQMLAQMGQVVNENDLAEIIRKVDTNGDGKLDYGEFARMMRAGGRG